MNAATHLIHDQLRLPPFSIEAEQGVIGSLMLRDAAWDVVVDILVESDFYRKDHRLIFRAIKALAEQDKPRDVVTLSEWLEQRGELDKAGGMLYLGTLAKDTPSAANVKAYSEIVREKSLLRALIVASEQSAADAYSPGNKTVSEIIDKAQAEILSLSSEKKSGQTPSLKELISSVIDKVDERFNNQDMPVGIPTGFSDLDKKILGLEKQDLIIVAGRPSMGKTSFAMNIAESVAIKQKLPVAVFSMEMSGEQLTMRMMSSISGISLYCLRTGKICDKDWPKMTAATSLMRDAKIIIDDRPALSVPQVRARCRQIKREHGLSLIVIDYIQLMTAHGKENRATEVSEISRGLKAIAKEMDVTVIALSQLNRSLESRPNRRPVMSDLRESGAIEQDADIIIFLYRDAVYNEETKYPNVAEANIAKQRNGPTGKIFLHTELHRVRFMDHTDEIPEYEQRYDKKGGLD